MSARIGRAVAVLVGTLCVVGSADAQTLGDAPFRRWAIEAGAGGLWQGGLPLGTATATLTGNQPSLPPVTFFRTSTTFEPSGGFSGHLGVHLTRMFAVEGALRYAQPRLETSISADIEDAPLTVATQDLSQYLFEVNAVAHLLALQIGGSTVPFVFGGAGYLRELYDGRRVVETGQTAQFGGGVKILFRRSAVGVVKAMGLRAEGRVVMRRSGVELDADEPLRTFGAGGASFIVVF